MDLIVPPLIFNMEGFDIELPAKVDMPLKQTKLISSSEMYSVCYILTLDRAVNQEMHLCKSAEAGERKTII